MARASRVATCRRLARRLDPKLLRLDSRPMRDPNCMARLTRPAARGSPCAGNARSCLFSPHLGRSPPHSQRPVRPPQPHQYAKAVTQHALVPCPRWLRLQRMREIRLTRSHLPCSHACRTRSCPHTSVKSARRLHGVSSTARSTDSCRNGCRASRAASDTTLRCGDVVTSDGQPLTHRCKGRCAQVLL